MNQLIAASGLMLVFSTVSSAQAQVTLGISKITCEQFAKYKITTPDNIAIWLSGYRRGKLSNTNLDTQALIANSQKLLTYCRRNPETLVMQAGETGLGRDR